MGKRDGGKFPKSKRDYYPTVDPDAVKPLLSHIVGINYAEPCCGEGHLINLIGDTAKCKFKSDLLEGFDARNLTENDVKDCDAIITNPPYTWSILSDLMDTFWALRPTFLLLPADMMHNKRMAPFVRGCSKIISVGRLYWQENKVKGVDNYAWYVLEPHSGPTEFIGRQA